MRYISIIVTLFLIACNMKSQPLPKWEKGFLDIHFISTGCGNCTLIIMPDSTTMLVDAGEQDPTSPRTLSPRNTPRYPNYSKMGYQWQTDYIRQMLSFRQNAPLIDYAFITHFHSDHFGCMYPSIVHSDKGNYYLTGITGVGEAVGISKLVDRGWDYPIDLREEAQKDTIHPTTMSNYFNFIDWSISNRNMQYQKFIPGSKDQFPMLHQNNLYNFYVENIQANGVVIKEGKPYTKMPSTKTMNKEEIPGENHLSAGILLHYGDFKCYIGGDISGTAPEFEDKPIWHDVESVVAPIVGEVDVTTANHHANRDAMTSYFLSILKPRVIIQEVWSSDHPGHEALLRMTSQKIWKGERDIFSTAMLEANRLVIGELLENSYRSMNGHIVLRVFPNGTTYKIYILDNMTEAKQVKACFGPYKTKKK